MSRGVCAIGVGGSGQNVLIALKERLIETYGKVPDSVVLLSLDTAPPDASMSIGGINLNMTGAQRVHMVKEDRPQGGQIEPVEEFLTREREVLEKERPPEFHPLITDQGKNVDDVIRAVVGQQAPYLADWVEVAPLIGLPPANKIIAAGAGQLRPLGRIALFLDYPNVYAEIANAFDRLFRNPPFPGDKHNVFVIGSVAGGTGSGILIDVLNIIARTISRNPSYQMATLTTFIVLPSAFQDYAETVERGSIQPNSYAALRELDRFQFTHSNTRPTLVRYGTNPNDIYWITAPLSSYVYLVDTTVPGAAGGQARTNPRHTVFPAIADFIAAKVTDPRMPSGQPGGGGFMIEAIENNFRVTLQEPWLKRKYLGLNTFTYIVPINDIVRSLCFRYLHDMHGRIFGDPSTAAQTASVKQAALERVERVFAATTVTTLNRNGAPEKAPVPALIDAVVNATKAEKPQPLSVEWASLLRLLARSQDEYQKDNKALQQSLDYIEDQLLNTMQYSRREERESFEEGTDRLVKTGDRLMTKFLGPQNNPKDPQSREGGEWDKRLSKYDELREMFARALDIVVREELNRRDDQGKLLPNRLLATRALVENVRDRLRVAAKQLDDSMVSTGAPQRYKDLITTQLKEARAEMEDTMNDTFIPLLAEKPLKKQKAYIEAVTEYLRLELALRMFAFVKRMLNIFGTEDAYEWKDDEGKAHKEPSVVARGLKALDNWCQTLKETDDILEKARKRHDVQRTEKARIRVRRYLTDREYEDKIYERCLPALDKNLQGKGEDGTTLRLHWARKRLPDNTDDEPPLLLELLAAWSEHGVGPVDLAICFMEGARQAIEPVVRRGVTIANRLCELPEFKDQPEKLAMALKQQVDRPLLRNEATGLAQYRVLTFPSWGRPEAMTFLQKMAQHWQAMDEKKFNRDARESLESGECAASLTTISFTGAVAMHEVQQFKVSETAYRTKVAQGEPVHVFPEEQQAIRIEHATPTVFPQPTPRTFSPEVVICMADKKKLLVYAAACAYDVIRPEIVDPKAPIPTREVFLFLPGEAGYERKQLSHSALIQVPPGQQVSEGRLHLDALQQFCIVKTERVAMSNEIVSLVMQRIQDEILKDPTALSRPKEQVFPFTLNLNQVEAAMNRERQRLGPSLAEEPDPRKREQKNAQRCLEKVIAFKRTKVDPWMESPDLPVQDLGILMALMLAELEQALRNAAGS